MTTLIPIERLLTGTYITVPGYDAVEVYEAKFDGYGYYLTYCTNDRYGWDTTDNIYIPVGECVEFAGNGEPSLRNPDITEIEALREAREAAALAPLVSATAFFCTVLTDRYAESVREGSDQLEAAE